MTKAARNFIFIGIGLVACGFASKLLWDEYQMRRATEQNPIVVALVDRDPSIPGLDAAPHDEVRRAFS